MSEQEKCNMKRIFWEIFARGKQMLINNTVWTVSCKCNGNRWTEDGWMTITAADSKRLQILSNWLQLNVSKNACQTRELLVLDCNFYHTNILRGCLHFVRIEINFDVEKKQYQRYLFYVNQFFNRIQMWKSSSTQIKLQY